LFAAQSFVTAFLAAEEGVEDTYKPCSLFPITTVKWRFVSEEVFLAFLPRNCSIYNFIKS
jgi:hypothetical protein